MPKADKAAAPKAVKAAAKPKKEKKEKDPNAPKKPLGAYMIYCKDNRAAIVKENPDQKVSTAASTVHSTAGEDATSCMQNINHGWKLAGIAHLALVHTAAY